MELQDRFLKALEYVKIEKNILTNKQFCLDIDINETVLSNFLSGKRPLPMNDIYKFVNKYNISLDWLLIGKGSMLRDSFVSVPIAVSSKRYINGIPLIPLDAIAGLGNFMEYQIKESDIEERYIVPDFDRVKPDYLIRTKGNSMYPKYSSGDILACKSIDKNNYIQWNKPYVLDTKTNGVLVKRIHQSESPNKWKLVSDNKEYCPFEIPIEEVRNISLVVGVIRLE